MPLQFLVFVSGATVMILEMVSARFFAPYIGTSITVWTSVIGIIMAGLSAGYYLGGMLGDAWKSKRKLRAILFLAALWIGLLAAFHRPAVGWFTSVIHDPVWLAIAAAASLLLIPSVLLGSVTPYAVRLTAHDVKHVGRIAGTLSALSTAGSILGTFAAGLILIPAYGVTAILFGCSAVLGCAALLSPRMRSLVACMLFLLTLLLLLKTEEFVHDRMMQRRGIVSDTDSAYSVIRIVRLPAANATTGLETVFMDIDHGNHSAYTPAKPDTHVFAYTSYYRISDAFRPDAKRILLIGGGAHTVSRDFLRRHPDSHVDVIEIDPAVTALAREYFDLKDDARMTIDHEDARRFLNRGGMPDGPSLEGSYQVVYGDAFRSEYSVPFHLASLEAAQRISAMLDADGVYVLNIIASEEGKRNQILAAELATLREVFPSVMALRVPMGSGFAAPGTMENITLVASKKPVTDAMLSAVKDPELKAMLANRIDTQNLPEIAALTDDYAPVEAMLSL